MNITVELLVNIVNWVVVLMLFTRLAHVVYRAVVPYSPPDTPPSKPMTVVQLDNNLVAMVDRINRNQSDLARAVASNTPTATDMTRRMVEKTAECRYCGMPAEYPSCTHCGAPIANTKPNYPRHP